MTRADAAVRALVRAHGWNATAYQVLNPGLHHWLAPRGEGAVGYVPVRTRPGGRPTVWMAAGAPIAPADALDRVGRAFELEAGRHGAAVCWFGADLRWAALRPPSAGWRSLRLGAQPVFEPARWPGAVAAKASLRAQLHRARNKGVAVEEWPAARAAGSPELGRLLRAWLRRRGLPPLHFLVEPFTLATLLDRRVFVAERDGGVVGFLVLTPVPARPGWLVEQIVRGPAAPNGTAELLVDAAFRAAAHEPYLTLGLAPLSPRAGRLDGAGPTRLALAWVRAHTRRFYNFEGLERFKAKFQPQRWDPIVALAPGGVPEPALLYAIADAFSGARSPERLVADAVRRAAREEARRLRGRLASISRPVSS